MSGEHDAYIDGYNQGWGECLGKVIGYLRKQESWGDLWDIDTMKEYVLSKHPHRSSTGSAKT